jgi:hypothetical protein
MEILLILFFSVSFWMGWQLSSHYVRCYWKEAYQEGDPDDFPSWYFGWWTGPHDAVFSICKQYGDNILTINFKARTIEIGEERYND